jgi:hypothetical protein
VNQQRVQSSDERHMLRGPHLDARYSRE